MAGSIETLYIVATGELSLLDYLTQYGILVLPGNSLGMVFVALLNHAQVAAKSRDS